MNKSIITSAAIILLSAIPSLASAATTEEGQDFAFKHPARTQVVYRIERVEWIIARRQQDGDFTGHQAAALKAEAGGIRGEEQYFASQHGGRLTATEQNRLNWELNGLVKQLNV